MNRLILALLPALALAASAPGEQAFEDFVQRFGKAYHGAEKATRLGIFLENYAYIQKENTKGTNTYKLGVTEFADQTAEEFQTSHFGFNKPKKVWGELPNLGTHEYTGEALAASVDWRSQGAVTPVKNQGQCGSCWAFSTTGSLEGANKIANGELVSFSEQQLVDCAGSYGNNGCGGGLMDNGFKYVEASDLCTEDSYPYTAADGSCHASGCSVGLKKGSVSGYKDVSQDSEQALMSAIQQGPVSIAIEADKSAFQLYTSGVLTSTCGTNLDHGVLAVGYGTEGGTDYWLVKNSWGSSWGDEGYVKLLRGKGGAGECGLLQSASYPVMGGSAVVV